MGADFNGNFESVSLEWINREKNPHFTELALPNGNVVRLKEGVDSYTDANPVLGINCYKLQAGNSKFYSGPVKGCVNPANFSPRNSPGSGYAVPDRSDTPRYVTEAIEPRDVGLGAQPAPALPVVRIYEAYDPWGMAAMEEALEAWSHTRGLNLFVHPVEDLALGIPDSTALVVIPAASYGDWLEQVTTVNGTREQRELADFVHAGGRLLLHRWMLQGSRYRIPVPKTKPRRFAGYDLYRHGKGTVYATSDAIGSPEDTVLLERLDRLLERILR